MKYFEVGSDWNIEDDGTYFKGGGRKVFVEVGKMVWF